MTERFAHARSVIELPESMRHLLGEDGDIQSKKGPVFATAIIAGTMGVKRTSELIPFCHPLPIEDCKVQQINTVSRPQPYRSIHLEPINSSPINLSRYSRWRSQLLQVAR